MVDETKIINLTQEQQQKWIINKTAKSTKQQQNKRGRIEYEYVYIGSF